MLCLCDNAGTLTHFPHCEGFNPGVGELHPDFPLLHYAAVTFTNPLWMRTSYAAIFSVRELTNIHLSQIKLLPVTEKKLLLILHLTLGELNVYHDERLIDLIADRQI